MARSVMMPSVTPICFNTLKKRVVFQTEITDKPNLIPCSNFLESFFHKFRGNNHNSCHNARIITILPMLKHQLLFLTGGKNKFLHVTWHEYKNSIIYTSFHFIFSLELYGDDVRQASVFFWLWIVAAVVSTCYTLTWDIKMDWGLLDKNAGENKFLREETVYAFRVCFYLINVSSPDAKCVNFPELC